MTGDNRIIAFGANEGSDARAESAFASAIGGSVPDVDANPEHGAAPSWDAAPEIEPEAPDSKGGVLAGAFAVLAVVAWTGFYLFAQRGALQTAIAPADIAALIVGWSTPVMLIGVAWLLAMRHSAREGRRFGDVARLLSTESKELEARLVSVNRELSLAREFIAAQSRDLEALGRMAADRLSQNAEQLRGLIADNGTRVETIGTVSKVALENMEKLRGQLPVIASSAKDVTNNIGNAGRAAHAQLEDMINGFNRLNEFGTASERQVASLRQAVEDALGLFAQRCAQLEEITDNRFAALNQRSEEFRTALDVNEVEALAAMRSRIGALAEEIDATRAQLDQHEAESLTSLRARLVALRDESDVVSRALSNEQGRALAQWQADLAALESTRAAHLETAAASQADAIAGLSQSLAGIAAEIARVDGEAASRAERYTHDASRRFAAIEVEVGKVDNDIAARAERMAAQIAQRLSDIESDIARVDADIAQRAARLAHEAELRRDQQAATERELAASLDETLTGIEARMAAHQAAQRHHLDQLALSSGSLASRVDAAAMTVSQIATDVRGLDDEMAARLSQLADRLTSTRATLASTDQDVARVTDASLRLLELIQASSKHAHDKLPEALAFSESRLERAETRVSTMMGALHQSGENAQALSGAIESCTAALATLAADLAASHTGVAERGAEQEAALDALGKTVAEIEAATDRASLTAREDLAAALAALSEAQADAAQRFETEATARINAFAGTLGEESVKAIEKAMRPRVAEIAGQLEQAVAHSSGVSREASRQLRDQLAQVEDLLANLERRVAEARGQAEDQVDNDFARRAALITESLNSSAIDITTALSSDIADTAWAAYLRGDRGIFTRRAVSLLDAGEARSIQQVYERDDGFREQVNRYIHDFEAILRQVLSTRDGNALGVTLLSSDMGKLYVALAQGIERLRN